MNKKQKKLIKDFLNNFDNLLKSIDKLRTGLNKAKGKTFLDLFWLISGVNVLDHALFSHSEFIEKLKKLEKSKWKLKKID